jgi:hypothetical protein
MRDVDIRAFESIHQLAGAFQTFPHHMRLLSHDSEGLFEKPALVLDGSRRGRHGVWGVGERRWSGSAETPRNSDSDNNTGRNCNAVTLYFACEIKHRDIEEKATAQTGVKNGRGGKERLASGSGRKHERPL